MSAAAIERPALYYPYIHVRAEQEPWLKATLLLHPSVVRMVPPDYEPEDPPNLLTYVKMKGSADKLLNQVSTSYDTAQKAKERLLNHIKKNLAHLKRHYTRQRTSKETKIQRAKFIFELLQYLEKHDLAWETTGEGRYGKRDWRGLHPTLGNAIMSTIATSIATDRGWHIVTPEPALHKELLGVTEEEIFHRLTNTASESKADLNQQTANELGELVLMTSINVDNLRPEDIVELQTNKQDLRSFRDMLVERAQRIGSIPDPEARTEALEPLNKEIQDAWADYKKALPLRIAKTLFDASNIKVPQLGTTVGGAATTVYTLGATAGLAVSLLAYADYATFKEYQEHEKSPYKYLSTIEKRTKEYETLSTSPLGLTRDESTKRRSN